MNCVFARIVGSLLFCLISSNGLAQGMPDDAWAKSTLGYYRFDQSGVDALGKSPAAELKGGVMYLGDVLSVNGEYEHGAVNGFRAIVDTPTLNQDAFSVSLHFYPRDFETQLATSTVSWRLREVLFRYNLISKPPSSSGHEALFMAGKSYRWFGYKMRNGNLCLSLNNAETEHEFPGVAVEPGRWHLLIASVDRKARRVATRLDGVSLPDVVLPEGFQWNTISDREAPEDRNFGFTDYSNGTCFHGFVGRLRILDRSLDAGELDRYALAMKQDAPIYSPIEGTSAPRWLWAGMGLIALLVLFALLIRRRALGPRRMADAATPP